MPLAARSRAALTIVALALVGAAIATCPRDDASVAPEAREPTGTTPRPPSAPRSARRVAVTEPSATVDAAPPAEPAKDGDASGAPVDDGFPTIDVEVVHADGSPARQAWVYALRPGAAGRDDLSAGSLATTRITGACRVPVARAGLYDVGAVLGPFHAMARDVAIPSAEPVRIVLPPGDALVVVATQAAAGRLAADRFAQPVSVTLAADEGSVPRTLPGRAEALAWTYPVRLRAGETECRFRLPSGATARIDATEDFAAVPPAARVPATVHLDLSHRHFVALTIELDRADATDVSGYALIDIEPGGSEPVRHVDLEVPRKALLPRERTLATFPVDGASGTIRWSGRGIVAGSADYAGFAPDVHNPLDITVRLDGTPLPFVPPGLEPDEVVSFVQLRVTDPSGSADPVACFVTGDDGDRSEDKAAPGEVAVLVATGPAWIVAARGGDVAGPARIDPSAGGVSELTLRPGGFVIFRFEATPPQSLGPVTVERADGLPILSDRLMPRVGVRSPRRIGPMLPGSYEFVVRAGEDEIGRVTAEVAAGADVVVRIPRVSSR